MQFIWKFRRNFIHCEINLTAKHFSEEIKPFQNYIFKTAGYPTNLMGRSYNIYNLKITKNENNFFIFYVFFIFFIYINLQDGKGAFSYEEFRTMIGASMSLK